MLSPSELAYLVGVDPKWIHNAALRLKRPIRHSVKEAIRLSLARRLHEGISIPLPRAVQLADDALHGDIDAPFTVVSADGSIELTIHVTRFLIAFNARLGWMRTELPLATRGRKITPRRENAIAQARAYGLDISLIKANLALTPSKRLTALDDNMNFIAQLQQRKPRRAS